jgi:hypothetical protein
VVQTVGRALAGLLVILSQGDRQLQGLEVMREHDLRRLGHAAFPDRRPDREIKIGMDGKATWRDNVFMERPWRTIKNEEDYLRAYVSVSEARAGIGRHLTIYNTRRPHSSLDGKPPIRPTSTSRCPMRWRLNRDGNPLRKHPQPVQINRATSQGGLHVSRRSFGGHMPKPLRLPVVAVVTLLGSAVLPVSLAAEGADAAALYEALHLSEIVAIMREEGLASAEQTALDLFGGTSPSGWVGAVEAIYDTERMETEVKAALDQATSVVDLGPIVAFFTSNPGAEFVDLEVAARRALLDDEVERMAKEEAAVAVSEKTPLFEQVDRFVTVNDLIEANVVAALNSSYAFTLGLMDGGGLPEGVTEDDILGGIWAQEPQFRASTEEWIYAFLVMAYAPAAPDDVEAYIAFSKTEAGRAANRAIFAAFDRVFESMSSALGQTAAQFLAGEEL